MTVHLTMRSKCTCNNNTTTTNSLKSNLINNYINNNNNNTTSSSNLTQRVVTIILLDSTHIDFNFDVSTTIRLIECSIEPDPTREGLIEHPAFYTSQTKTHMSKH